MILGLDPVVVAVIAAMVLVGSLVQSLVGLGLGLVSAPVVTILAPETMPVLLLVLGFALPCVTLWREHRDIDWRGLAWALPTRFPGTWLGVALLTAFSDRALGVFIALVVLAATLVTALAPHVRTTPTALLLAGFGSGVTSTVGAIGGPPIAIVYQTRPAHQIRSTLAVYFIVGSLVSLGGLAIGGKVDPVVLLLGLLLLPCLVIGTVLGRLTQDHVDQGRIRWAVLAVCALSALVLLVRSLV